MSDAAEYVIWSFEHGAWWRPGSWGYTRELAEAGRFSKAAADRIVADANIVSVHEVAMLASEAAAGGAGALYRSLSTDELVTLRAAFMLDRTSEDLDEDGRSFITGRLILIAAELAGRKARP